MCGVLAFIDLSASLPALDEATVRHALDLMSHRGPDASGVMRLAQGKVVLGHRRLSIVNLGRDANQPMTDATATVAVTFNGEIYNHVRLRRDLEREGAIFRTNNSDTEVLIQGFMRWGWEGLLDRLHGMFAFVLWDGLSHRLLAARDRLGIKPLYYARVGGRLVLASEAKAIAQLPDLKLRMNRRACLDVLNVLATPAPETLFDGIFKLGPGKTLCVTPDGRVRKQTYWRPPQTATHRNVSANEVIHEITRLSREAVLDRVPDEVHAGVMLSGGVDSGLILGIAAQAGHRLKAFTARFEGDELDESTAARETARHFGCEHVTVDIDERNAMRTMLRLVQDMDEPIADWACLPLQYLSEAARGDGIKVALVGEGADELFCGYPTWRGFVREQFLWRSLAGTRDQRINALISRGARLLGARMPLRRFGLIGAMDVAASVAEGRGRFRSGAESMRPLQIARLLKSDWEVHDSAADVADDALLDASSERSLDERLARQAGGYPDCILPAGDIFANLRRRDLAFRLPELLLMRVDKITMASSIEARVPFLDHRLVEYVVGLPESIVLQDVANALGCLGKPLFRAAAASVLPASVVDRAKVGLGAPMARWLRGPLGAELECRALDDARCSDSPLSATAVRWLFERHRSGERDYSSYIWPIVNVALWRHRWLRP